MGEAVYYGKLYFNTNKDAKLASDNFKNLLLEFCHADDWWQENRFWKKEDEKRDWFWENFADKFPNVKEYLEYIKLWGNDYNNELAGYLDFLSIEEDLETFEVKGKHIAWHSEVWHFAKWQPFGDWIESKFGCEFRWTSDEWGHISDLKR